MATPVLNNGIFYNERSYYTNTRFVDEYHVSKLLQETQPTTLGPVAIWAMARMAQTPLYNLSLINKKNIIEVDDIQGRYSWELPINYEVPQIVEDIEPANVQKGKFGAIFRLKFNRGDFGPGAIITCDPFNGPEVYIVDVEAQVANGTIYTCRLASNLNSFAYLDNIYVQPGIRWTLKSTAYNSWSTKFQGATSKGGYRTYYNHCPNVQAGREEHITEEALNAIMVGKPDEKLMRFTEIYQVANPDLIDSSVNSFQAFLSKVGGVKGLTAAIKRGDVNMMLINKKEQEMLDGIIKDIENELMWGQGGILVENQNAIRRNPGLWRQFDFGYKRVYDYHTFSLNLIKEVIFNFFVGKSNFEPNDPSRHVFIDTGLAGMDLVNKAIANDAIAAGFQIQAAGANGIGAISGKNMDLEFGFRFSTFIIPQIAKVTFRYNPALDVVNANEVTNPMINGYRLSSYSFLIYDIGENLNDNIVFLKWHKAEGPKWIYKNGSCDYKGSMVVQSVGDFSGYKLNVRQYVPGIHVKDPTRIAKIVMRNPITGGTL